MKRALVLLALAGAVWFGIHMASSPKGPDLTIGSDEVLLATGDLDVRFNRGKPFDGTYMVFGGGSLDHPNALANISLAGLSVRHAKAIHSRYPDFHRCASPGAPLAKEKVVSLDIVPADGETLGRLRSTLEDFDDSIRNGGDRVCVELHGTRLELAGVEVREVGEDVTDTIQMTKFYLVDSVSRVDCQQAMRDA